MAACLSLHILPEDIENVRDIIAAGLFRTAVLGYVGIRTQYFSGEIK